MLPDPGTAIHEPPLAVLDAIYDDWVRVRITPRALEQARTWLGAERLEVVGQPQPAARTKSSQLHQAIPAEGEDGQVAPHIVACWQNAGCVTEIRRQQFAALARHLSRARTFRLKFVESRRMGEVFNSGLDRLSIGLITVYPDGRPITANRVAGKILEERDGITMVSGKLSLAMAAEQKALCKLLEKVFFGEEGQGGMRVTRPSGRADLNLLVLRPPPRPGVIRSGLRILVRNPEFRTVHSHNALRDLYGFTGTEAAISMHLANGLSVEDIEGQFGIRHNTMRAHLRSIYAKLGVGSQAEFVHAILTGASALVLEGDDGLPEIEPLMTLVQ